MLYALVHDLLDEESAAWGDPRRCPVHGCATSSRDGLHDGLCGRCEMETEAEDEGPVSVPAMPDLRASAPDDDIPF